MTLQLHDSYFVEVDRHNFTLKKLSPTKPKDGGKPGERTITLGYFGNLSSALDRYFKERIRDSLEEDLDAKTLATTLDVILEELQADLEKTFELSRQLKEVAASAS